MAPNPSLRGRSPCDVFRIRDISEASICIYLDSVSKELFKIGAIWINGCGTNCFLSVHIKNATFSKWITNTVITETGMLSQGPVPELRADLGTPCPEGPGTCSIGSGGPRGPALGWAGRLVWDSACPRRASERPAPSPPARVPGGCALPLGAQCPRAHIAVTVGSHGMQAAAPAVPGDIMLSTHTLSFLPNVPELGGHARQCSSRGGERGTPPGGGRRTRGPCAARGPDPRRTLLPVTALGTRPRAGASGWAAAHVRAAGGVLGPPWGECLSWGRRQVCPRQSCVCSSPASCPVSRAWVAGCQAPSPRGVTWPPPGPALTSLRSGRSPLLVSSGGQDSTSVTPAPSPLQTRPGPRALGHHPSL